METTDGATIKKDKPTLDQTPSMHGSSRKVRLARRLNARSQNNGLNPREGVRTKTKNNVLKTKKRFLLLVSLSSPRSLVTPDPSNGKGSGLTWGLIRVYIHLFSKIVAALDPFLMLKNLVASSAETND